MSEYVDKGTLIDEFYRKRKEPGQDYRYAHFKRGDLDRVENVLFVIASVVDSAPAADVAPVIHAKWIRHTVTKECSNCHGLDFNPTTYFPPYCSLCGAKMDADKSVKIT